MIIFEPKVAEGFEILNACDGKDYEVLASLDANLA